MKLNVLRANPAGNITLFVLDPVPSGDRAGLSARLMAGSDIEQVGFVCPPSHGGAARMEMAGGEFCGNATRAFGMFTADGLGRPSSVQVEVSGCDTLITVDVDWSKHTARSQMPLPRSVAPAEADGQAGTLVDLGGIAHFVVEGVTPSLEFFQKAEPLFQDIPELDAYGVIFLDTVKGTMTPLVKVPPPAVWFGRAAAAPVPWPPPWPRAGRPPTAPSSGTTSSPPALSRPRSSVRTARSPPPISAAPWFWTPLWRSSFHN